MKDLDLEVTCDNGSRRKLNNDARVTLLRIGEQTILRWNRDAGKLWIVQSIDFDERSKDLIHINERRVRYLQA